MSLKIYTKTGDDGTTGIQGGNRISKSDLRIVAYGTVDEVNSVIGIILSYDVDEDIRFVLTEIQNQLFIVGADLSNPDLQNSKNRVNNNMVEYLEMKIDEYEKKLIPITNFILPGGNTISSLLHFSRTVVRRAETQIVSLSQEEQINKNCVMYVNRLSDLLFVLGRTINKKNGIDDIIWQS